MFIEHEFILACQDTTGRRNKGKACTDQHSYVIDSPQRKCPPRNSVNVCIGMFVVCLVILVLICS